MPYCPSCGEQIFADEIQSGQKFCGNCGQSVSGLASFSHGDSANAPSAPPQTSKERKKKGGFFGFIGKALLFIVGLGVIGYVSDEVKRSRNSAIFRKQMQNIRTRTPVPVRTRPADSYRQNSTRQRHEAREAARGRSW